MMYEETFTIEAREHYNSHNGGLTGTVMHDCSVCNIIRAFLKMYMCPTCKRPR